VALVLSTPLYIVRASKSCSVNSKTATFLVNNKWEKTAIYTNVIDHKLSYTAKIQKR